MTTILSVASQKGGVGKTTLALNLAYSFAKRNRRVLLLDSDPQGGIGISLSQKPGRARGMAGMVASGIGLKEAITHTKLPQFDILLLGKLAIHDTHAFGERLRKDKVFSRIREEAEVYDLIIMDTPPGFTNTTMAALTESDWILSPLQAEPNATRTLPQLLKIISHLRCKGATVQLLGLVLNMVQFDSEVSLSIVRETVAMMPTEVVLKTKIPRDHGFLDASSRGLPLGLMSISSPVSLVFDQLVMELEPRFGLTQEEVVDESANLFT